MKRRVSQPSRLGRRGKGFRGRVKTLRVEWLEPRYLLSGTSTESVWFHEFPLNVGPSPQSVALADINQDGILDLITAHDALSRVSVRLGAGDGTFGEPAHYGLAAQPFSVAVGDINADGVPDIIVSLRFEDQVAVLLGQGNGTFALGSPIATGDYPTDVRLVDLNGDGRLDIVTADYNGGTVSVILALEEGGFAPASSLAVGDGAFGLAVADLNGDEIQDLVVVSSYSRRVSVLLGQGDGTFGSPEHYSVGNFAYAVAVGDVNGDGKPDVAVSNAGDNNVQLFLNDGSGALTPGVTLTTRNYPGPLALADFTGDGILDLAVACTWEDVVQVYRGHGDGTFVLWRESAVGTYPIDMATGDLNSDNRLDIVTANYDAGSVSILLQELDLQPPTSTFTVFPAEAWGQPVSLSWAGDDGGGSGVAKYNVWYRRAGETEYTLWLANTTQTTALFQAEPGYAYEFVVTATDWAGNEEAIPDSPEAVLNLLVRPVDYLVIGQLSGGETLYPIRSTQAGILTLIASGLDAAAGEKIELYDAQKQLLTTTQADGDVSRLDWNVPDAGTMYFFKIVGQQARSIKLLNLVAIQGQNVTVSSSQEADWLIVNASTRTLAINDVIYQWPEGESIIIEAHGGDGQNVAQLYDSPGDDLFIAQPAESRLQGPGYQVIVRDYRYVHAYRTSGSGNDTAQLSTSTDDDHVRVFDVAVRVRGSDFLLRTKFFKNVALNSGGGQDRLRIIGSGQNDLLTVNDQGLTFQTESLTIQSSLMSDIYVFGGEGQDTAVVDSGNALVALDATVTRLRLIAADLSYVIRLAGFESVTVRNQNPASQKRIEAAVDYLFLEGPWAT